MSSSRSSAQNSDSRKRRLLRLTHTPPLDTHGVRRVGWGLEGLDFCRFQRCGSCRTGHVSSHVPLAAAGLPELRWPREPGGAESPEARSGRSGTSRRAISEFFGTELH